MAKKVLFCATVDYHFQAFHLPYMKWFQEQGWEVHVAASGKLELPYTDKKFDIPFRRSPFKLGNIDVYAKLKSIIDDNNYELVHCHTPMGGVLARLAARGARRRGTRVLYTAHGFHFCKGAPLLNWLVYYPIEKMLSRYTDRLITINEEDHRLAVERRFKAGRVDRVHGVGVDLERFRPLGDQARQEARAKLGYAPDDFLMFYAAEFNRNKNQQWLIRALALAGSDAPRARLLLAGEGELKEACANLARELGVERQVEFLGYRSDIAELLPLCDAAVASSLREGLPVNIMEAMACGLPVIATENRGHSELIADGLSGYVIRGLDERQCAERIAQLSQSRALRERMGRESRDRMRHYSLERVGVELTGIYAHYFLEGGDETKSKYSGAYI
ncbi:glycosyltransferase family 4 protein [Paenibacillus doosanensis]|uniref:Glycosyltransferase EpsD n=1 Tax=Paenibacillus konkukensis TaxID=2020716 RepID=A0ABY4RSZ7_9BACL|nr:MULTISPECIES: glycosyltransferase family 4 protein [Paenibacillus]MCS7461024.1 glycosyltransferase family 4 protein [Paenibacillus doosanensis]UQZ85696.1 Putative glycosyltransferase EpsD [Paenibacillus konkukensis]